MLPRHGFRAPDKVSATCGQLVEIQSILSAEHPEAIIETHSRDLARSVPYQAVTRGQGWVSVRATRPKWRQKCAPDGGTGRMICPMGESRAEKRTLGRVRYLGHRRKNGPKYHIGIRPALRFKQISQPTFRCDLIIVYEDSELSSSMAKPGVSRH
jgi:hypothetical protein